MTGYRRLSNIGPTLDRRVPPISASPSGDLDIKALKRVLSVRLVGRRVLLYDSLSSTMDEARRLVDSGEPEGTIVIAEEQTAARGRFSRAWVSPRGQNVTFSALLRPSIDQLPFVNMAATLAVVEAISDLTGLTPTVKWPNDVRVGGRKICGILVETEMERSDVRFAVVGIGINVNVDTSRFEDVAPTATSILRETGKEADRTQLLQGVLERLDALYLAVKGGASLTERWAAKLETLGREVKVRWKDRVVEGRAQGVDDMGGLILARPDGSIFTVTAGEVTSQL